MEPKPGELLLLRFGEYELNPETGELWRGGLPVKLPPQPTKVLTLLASRSGQLVTRAELQHQLWDGHTVVDFEHGVNSCIKQIRTALNDDAEEPRFVETLPRRGYRFLVPAEPVRPAAAPASEKRPRWQMGAGIGLAVVVLAVVGYLAWQRFGPEPAPGRKVMLAVLPFENLSGDPEQDYFSDGLTEEMITQLGRLNPAQLGVIARTSAMHYKGSKKTVAEIGRELGVDYALEGSARREGERVRVSAQLIRVADQSHLWAESYDRDLESILAVQGQIAREVAAEIRLTISSTEQARLATPRPANAEAYEAYLKGRYLWHKQNNRDWGRAIPYYEKAIELDPKYAAPYAGLAQLLTYQTLFVGPVPYQEAFPRARAAATKAVELDPMLAEAHSALGMVLLHLWEWEWARREFERGLELNPNSPEPHSAHVTYLLAMARREEALGEARKAVELDPLSTDMRVRLAIAYFMAGQFEDCLRESERILEVEPNHRMALLWKWAVYDMEGKLPEAVEVGQKIGGRYADPESTAYARLYLRIGQREKAAQILAKDRATRRSIMLSAAYALLGEKDQAFAALEEAYQTREPILTYIRVDPRLDPLREDPRFRDLVRRMNFPEE